MNGGELLCFFHSASLSVWVSSHHAFPPNRRAQRSQNTNAVLQKYLFFFFWPCARLLHRDIGKRAQTDTWLSRIDLVTRKGWESTWREDGWVVGWGSWGGLEWEGSCELWRTAIIPHPRPPTCRLNEALSAAVGPKPSDFSGLLSLTVPPRRRQWRSQRSRAPAVHRDSPSSAAWGGCRRGTGRWERNWHAAVWSMAAIMEAALQNKFSAF